MTIYEILSRALPFSLNKNGPTQGVGLASAVSRDGLRPEVDAKWDSTLTSVMESCWKQNPKERPRMSNVAARIEAWILSFAGMKTKEDEADGINQPSFRIQKGMSQSEMYELWKLRELKAMRLVDEETAGISNKKNDSTVFYVALGPSLGQGSFAKVHLVEIGVARYAAKIFNSEFAAGLHG